MVVVGQGLTSFRGSFLSDQMLKILLQHFGHGSSAEATRAVILDKKWAWFVRGATI